MTPYSSARKEFSGSANIFLDANENSFGSPIGGGYNRYPDPLQLAVKKRLAEIKEVAAENIFLGNGSDEAIDLLFRIFCVPGRDKAIVCPPTYGMYEVSAEINDVGLVKVPLTAEFALDVEGVKSAFSSETNLLFICSPNNPTGNAFSTQDILSLAEAFTGIVVVDEAYSDFSAKGSLVGEIASRPNLMVLQTLSKAWGLAGLRIGMAFASPEIISLFNRAKPPYNISAIAQETALEALSKRAEVDVRIAAILTEREMLAGRLPDIDAVVEVFPSDANFILVKTVDAPGLYRHLLEDSIVVRNRDSVELCGGCLRITVGTPEENLKLVESMQRYKGI
jgi:histidinol-phosphate aminotransferase